MFYGLYSWKVITESKKNQKKKNPQKSGQIRHTGILGEIGIFISQCTSFPQQSSRKTALEVEKVTHKNENLYQKEEELNVSSQRRFQIPSSPPTNNTMRQGKKTRSSTEWPLAARAVCVCKTVTFSFRLGCSSYCHVSITLTISTFNFNFFFPLFIFFGKFCNFCKIVAFFFFYPVEALTLWVMSFEPATVPSVSQGAVCLCFVNRFDSDCRRLD